MIIVFQEKLTISCFNMCNVAHVRQSQYNLMWVPQCLYKQTSKRKYCKKKYGIYKKFLANNDIHLHFYT